MQGQGQGQFPQRPYVQQGLGQAITSLTYGIQGIPLGQPYPQMTSSFVFPTPTPVMSTFNFAPPGVGPHALPAPVLPNQFIVPARDPQLPSEPKPSMSRSSQLPSEPKLVQPGGSQSQMFSPQPLPREPKPCPYGQGCVLSLKDERHRAEFTHTGSGIQMMRQDCPYGAVCVIGHQDPTHWQRYSHEQPPTKALPEHLIPAKYRTANKLAELDRAPATPRSAARMPMVQQASPQAQQAQPHSPQVLGPDGRPKCKYDGECRFVARNDTLHIAKYYHSS